VPLSFSCLRIYKNNFVYDIVRFLYLQAQRKLLLWPQLRYIFDLPSYELWLAVNGCVVGIALLPYL